MRDQLLFIRIVGFFVLFTLAAGASGVEKLDRGLVGLEREDGSVFLSWRLLETDPEDIAFQIRRGDPKSSKSQFTVLTNDKPYRLTNFVDRSPEKSTGRKNHVYELYEYRRKKNKTEIASRNISFPDWVKMTYGENKDTFYYNNPRSFQPQVDWLKDKEGNISMDYVIRFESINEDFNHVKSVIGLDAALPHLNASARAGYQSYYDDETRDIVAHWFREDIDEFGYSFDKRSP